jgi:LysM repeat protein
VGKTPTADATSTLIALIDRPNESPTLQSTTPVTIAPSGPTATPFVHIVQQGETLLGIAIRYGVTLDELLLVNPGVDPRILNVGQNISIPGPGGEPIDMLLPTPTAMPLSIGEVHCFPTAGNTTRCLVKIVNKLNVAVEGIAVNISLFDSIGAILDQSQANSLTRALTQGKSSVLEAAFIVDSDRVIRAQAELISAVQVSNLEDRIIHVELTNLELKRASDNQLYQFEGLIELQEDQLEGEVMLIVHAFGYNSDAEPIGSNAIQIQAVSTDFPVSFYLSLFSLDSEIIDFELLLEAISLEMAE